MRHHSIKQERVKTGRNLLSSTLADNRQGTILNWHRIMATKIVTVTLFSDFANDTHFQRLFLSNISLVSNQKLFKFVTVYESSMSLDPNINTRYGIMELKI